MSEVWKPIAGFEDLYQVSNMGRVKSLSFRNNRVTICRERIMTPTDNGYGYLIVSLKRGGKRSRKYIHRLVAEAFCDNPLSKRYVNHIDHDTKNNAATNLEWCTQSENVQHSAHLMMHPKAKSKPTNTGEKYISRRLSRNGKPYYRLTIRRLGVYKNFKTLEEAMTFKKGVIG